ncbi:MAG: putative ribonuclease [Phycisphaerales bacterium]|nr:putative ribonuclease [Phycisphaerales bacterium]
MLYRIRRARSAGLLSFCALYALASVPACAVEIPDPQWDTPTTYYTAVGSGATQKTGVALRTQLQSILSSGSVNISYDAEKLSLPITDRVYGTTAAQKQMWGAYDRKVLTGVWDSAATWNREHVWPQSKLGGNSDHDMFGLRAAYVQSNGDRANYGYGGFNITDTTTLAGNLAKAAGATNPLFYAGAFDRGDTARACFYMATRYYVASAPTSTASLKILASTDGASPDGSLTDLNSMLRANYLDPVDNFERRRNSMIYNNTENASLSQKNRNPYVDHPEYVWSVFGDGANDSQITVNTGGTAGASSKAIDFGRVIVGGTAPALSTSVTINKTGADPTTFSIATSGGAVTDSVNNAATVRKNIYQTFDYGVGAKSIPVSLTATTAAAGLKTGTVTIDNTDITTQAAGTGNDDGDDTIDLSLAVLDHSNASFVAGSDVDAMTLNFGAVNKDQTATMGFSLYNLLAASGYTAGLDLDNITASGDTAMFGSGLGVFSALAGGSAADAMASFTPTTPGVFSATYVIAVSDENLSGATAGTSLTLTLTGVTNAFNVPEPTILALAPMLAMVLRRRGRNHRRAA